LPKYRPFNQNPEVIDAFCCVLLGHDTVNKIQKKLGQPQSTISEKLRFMVREGVIEKHKWVFSPNWDKIIEVSRKEIRKFFDCFLITPSVLNPTKKEVESSKKQIEKFMRFFDEEKIKLIITRYADYLINEGSLEKKSVSDIMMIYFDGLVQTDYEDLEKMNPKLTKLKKMLGMRSMEKVLFLEAEL